MSEVQTSIFLNTSHEHEHIAPRADHIIEWAAAQDLSEHLTPDEHHEIISNRVGVVRSALRSEIKRREDEVDEQIQNATRNLLVLRGIGRYIKDEIASSTESKHYTNLAPASLDLKGLQKADAWDLSSKKKPEYAQLSQAILSRLPKETSTMSFARVRRLLIDGQTLSPDYFIHTQGVSVVFKGTGSKAPTAKELFRRSHIKQGEGTAQTVLELFNALGLEQADDGKATLTD